MAYERSSMKFRMRRKHIVKCLVGALYYQTEIGITRGCTNSVGGTKVETTLWQK